MDQVIKIVDIVNNQIRIEDRYISDRFAGLVRQKLIYVREILVNILKDYKAKGIIKSLARPKVPWQLDKSIKGHISKVVLAKRTIDKSLRNINEIFK